VYLEQSCSNLDFFVVHRPILLGLEISMHSSVFFLQLNLLSSAQFVAGTNEGKFEWISDGTADGCSEELTEGFMVFPDGEVEGFFEGYSEKLTEGVVVLPDGEVEGVLDVLEGCSEETRVGTYDGEPESGSSDIETNTLSKFGPPFPPSAVTRTIFIPGLQTADKVLSCQSLQDLVRTKGIVPATLPFTVTLHGRDCQLPLTYRNWKVHGPPEDPPSISDHSKKDP